MNLSKLWVKGFGPFRDYQEFIFQPNSLTLITGRNGCLSGNTLIDTPRDLTKYPLGIPIRDLVGQNIVVYSYSHYYGRMVLCNAFNIRKTGVNKPVLRINYTGGRTKGIKNLFDSVVLTSDHLVMLRNGEYKKAKDLKPGDSLMPFYRTTDGAYAFVNLNNGERPYEHKFILSELQELPNYHSNKDFEGHHIDNNKLNNDLENLVALSFLEHKRLHYNDKGQFDKLIHLRKTNHPRGMLGKHHSQEVRERIGKTLLSNESWLAYRKTEEFSNKCSIGKLNAQILKKNVDQRLFTKISPEDLKQLYIYKGRSIPQLEKEFGVSQHTIKNGLRLLGIKIRDCTTSRNLVFENRRMLNHKVLSVKFAGNEDVYDMEIEGTHNFVANGIVVHNSGKSTMFIESLSFLWYNKPHRDLTVGDWIHEDCDQCEVGVVLDDGGEVIKTRDTKGNTIITMYGEPATQAHLENFIGIDKDLFFNSYIFAQGFGGFVFLKDSDKKKFIMKLSLGFLDKYLNGIYEVGDDYKRQIQELESDIEKYASERSQLNLSDLAANFKQYNEQMKQIIRKSKYEMQDLQSKLSNSNTVLITKNKELSRWEKELADLQVKLKQFTGETTAFEIDKVTHAERIKQLQEFILDLKEHKSTIRSHAFVDCPTCLRKMDTATKSQVEKKLSGQIRKLELEIQPHESEIRKLQISQNVVESKIRNIYSGQNERIAKCNQLRNIITDNEKRYTELQTQLTNLQEQMEQYSKGINPYQEMYEKAWLRDNDLATELDKLNRQLTRARKYIAYGVSFWEEKFHQLKSGIFTQILEGFGPLSNDYFSYISEGKYTMRFATDLKVTKKSILDKFEIEVFKGTQKVGFNRLSPGEKRQLALANNIAFIQLLNLYVGGDSNFVIMDEIFDQLDHQAKDFVFLILDQLREKTGKSLLLITHDSYIQDTSFKVNQVEVMNNGETSYLETKVYNQ